MTTAGFVYEARFLQHDTGNAAPVLAPNDVLAPDQHIESPRRIQRTVYVHAVSTWPYIVPHGVAEPLACHSTMALKRWRKILTGY